MFHKYVLLLNCLFLGFCGVSYCFPYIMQLLPSAISHYLEWHLPNLLLISQLIIFFSLTSVVFVIISLHFTTVRIGRPPVDGLTIAYKYGHSDSVSASAVRSSYEHFSSNDRIQICYERKVSEPKCKISTDLKESFKIGQVG